MARRAPSTRPEMTTPRHFHAGEADTNAVLVAGLLAAQFPQWSGMPITPIDSAGTTNAIYRLGDDLAVRLPRTRNAVSQVEKERTWLPRLAPHLPLAIPEPLAMGAPGEGYPWHWSIYRWLAGQPATYARLAERGRVAIELAAFLTKLQQIDPTGGPPAEDHNLRGMPLAGRDSAVREAIAALDGVVETSAVTAAWEEALRADGWDRAPVWIHGDMLPGNLLVERGRLSAVIDFGGLAVGDPACDLMIAWGLFSGRSRQAFRAALQVDDATWARGRGHALAQALIFIPYYLDTHPSGVAIARHTIDQVLVNS